MVWSDISTTAKEAGKAEKKLKSSRLLR